MPEMMLYEYAVIRVVPRVERGEYINAGVMLFCRDAKYLEMRFEINDQKILCLHPHANLEKINRLMHAFEKVCNGDRGASKIAELQQAERFRWLTAKRSTIIQVSEVHPGLTADPAEKLRQLFNDLIL